MTTKDLIISSLKLANLLSVGEDPSGEELDDAHKVLKMVLSSSQLDGVRTSTLTRSVFNFVNGQSQYFLAQQNIKNVSVILNGAELPCEILTTDEFAEIPLKGTPSAYPYQVFIVNSVNNLGGNQNATASQITFYPTPQGATQFVVYSGENGFDGVSLTALVPQTYQKYLRFALANDLMIEYGKAPNPLILQTIEDEKKKLIRLVKSKSIMKSDAAFMNQGKPWDYRTGE